MAQLKETTQEKKARRNAMVLQRYNELKQQMTTRNAQQFLADEFDISKDTIIKILYDPTYSNSPLPSANPGSGIQTTCQLT